MQFRLLLISCFSALLFSSSAFASRVDHPLVAPVAAFSFSNSCSGDTVHFTDLSDNSPVNYLWTFSGGNPGSSTLQNPDVVFSTPGTYNVKLVVSNASGSDSIIQVITIYASPAPPVVNPNGLNVGYCAGDSILLTSSYSSNITWNTGATTASVWISNPGVYSVTYTDANGCTSSVQQAVSMFAPPPPMALFPPTPIINVCGPDTIALLSNFGVGTGWNTGDSTFILFVSSSGVYTATFTDANGCSVSDSRIVTFLPLPPPVVITPGGPTQLCTGQSVTLTSSYSSGIFWSNADINPSILVNTTGVYSVTYTDTNGCSVTDSVQVIVSAYPPPVLISAGSPTSFCDGESVVLHSSYGTGNVWNTGDTNHSITVNTSGIYTVTYTNTGGCSVTASQTVTVHPLPVVTLSSYPVYCVNDAVFTIAGGSPSGGIYSGTGISGASFNPSLAGAGTHIIEYSYTDSNNCAGTDTSSLVVSACLGIETTDNSTLHIYPNPAENIIYIEGIPAEVTYTLYDVTGHIVQKGMLAGNTMMNMDGLANGIYYLEAAGEKIKLVKR